MRICTCVMCLLSADVPIERVPPVGSSDWRNKESKLSSSRNLGRGPFSRSPSLSTHCSVVSGGEMKPKASKQSKQAATQQQPVGPFPALSTTAAYHTYHPSTIQPPLTGRQESACVDAQVPGGSAHAPLPSCYFGRPEE